MASWAPDRLSANARTGVRSRPRDLASERRAASRNPCNDLRWPVRPVTEAGRPAGHDCEVALPVPPLAGEDHVCCECGVAYASIDVAAALEVIRAVPSAVGAVARSVPEAKVRLRPDEGTWSVLEYVYHLRDVYAVYTPSGPTGPGWRNARCWSRCSNDLRAHGSGTTTATSVRSLPNSPTTCGTHRRGGEGLGRGVEPRREKVAR